MAFDREPFPSEAVQYVTPSHRARRAAHYMAALGFWRPPSNPRVLYTSAVVVQRVHVLFGLFSGPPEVVDVDFDVAFP